MYFYEAEFFVFLGITVSLFWLFRNRVKIRNTILLIASYIFYMSWRPEYGLLLLASTIIDFVISQKMHRQTDKQKRKNLLILSLCLNLSLLIFFKYILYYIKDMPFMRDITFIQQIPDYWYILPIGISFYTFQTMGYSIDVYRGRRKPEKDPINFGLFVSFFPQLVAGPIEKAGRLLPQFQTKSVFDRDDFIYGIKRILRGLFKKVVIANTMAYYVNSIYSDPTPYNGMRLLLATVFFSNQVYCDFSGYADIAIGCARLFGIRIMENFRFPVLSRSITDFWTRWHISLTNWFKEYLFPALAPRGSGKNRILFSIFIILMLSGMWHGAKPTYLLWGGVFGFYFIFGALTSRLRRKLGRRFIRNNKIRGFVEIYSTLMLTTFSGIFFRAETAPHAFHVAINLWNGLAEQFYLLFTTPFQQFYESYLHITGFSKGDFLLAWYLTLFTSVYEIYFAKFRISDYFSEKVCFVLRGVFYINLLFLILLFSTLPSHEFIYFKF